MSDPHVRLIDLGERRIVSELISHRFRTPPNALLGIGDDCAVFPSPTDEDIVVTIDPCPTPVVCMLNGVDYYHYGWLTVVINVSDLAAMGATPIGMTVSTVMRPDMHARDYTRFLDGLAEASETFLCPVLGGNIKDGDRFDAVGSAFGSARRRGLLFRTGLSEGDRVCVIGTMGLFWAAVLSTLAGSGASTAALFASLHRPRPQIREGMALAALDVVTACTDSSDGVGASLYELAQRSRVDIVIDSEALQPCDDVRSVATAVGIDARKLLFAWGNWELVCGMPASAVTVARSAIESVGGRFSEVGVAVPGAGTVWLKEHSERSVLNDFASLRFSESSYMSSGLEAYIDVLRNRPLTRGPAVHEGQSDEVLLPEPRRD